MAAGAMRRKAKQFLDSVIDTSFVVTKFQTHCCSSSLLPNTKDTRRGALNERPALGAFAVALTLSDAVLGVLAPMSLARNVARSFSKSPLTRVAVAFNVAEDLVAARGSL